jgi:hypothetical protein
MSSKFSEAKKAVRRYILRSRDITNILRYGSKAPRYAERIWVRPQDVRHALRGPTNYVTCSGRVLDIEKHFRLIDLHETPRIRSCFAHWVDDVPWERTEDHLIMMEAIRSGKDWGWTEEDLVKRYARLDQAFRQTRDTMRLKTRTELDPNAFREEGGIVICIGRNGEPLLYDGFHRLAIALILELPIIPAQLGYVDVRAIESLERYRRPSQGARP